MARLNLVDVPYSRFKSALLDLLKSLGYIDSFVEKEAGRLLAVKLKYSDNLPALRGVDKISKPGLKRYANAKQIGKMRVGLGFIILSTPQGLKTHIQAKKENIGGEVICKIW